MEKCTCGAESQMQWTAGPGKLSGIRQPQERVIAGAILEGGSQWSLELRASADSIWQLQYQGEAAEFKSSGSQEAKVSQEEAQGVLQAEQVKFLPRSQKPA